MLTPIGPSAQKLDDAIRSAREGLASIADPEARIAAGRVVDRLLGDLGDLMHVVRQEVRGG